MDEVNVDPVDLGDELRQSIESGLHLAPVVLCRPIARELLHRRELHALRLIRDQFFVRPAHRHDAAFHVGERLVRKVNPEWFDRVGATRWLRLFLLGAIRIAVSSGPGIYRCVSHDYRCSHEKCNQREYSLHNRPPATTRHSHSA